MNDADAAMNTDRELWRECCDDYYSDSLHVTEGGGIGINCGGHVIVRPLRQWHDLDAKVAAVSARLARLEDWKVEALRSLANWYVLGERLMKRYPLTIGSDIPTRLLHAIEDDISQPRN